MIVYKKELIDRQLRRKGLGKGAWGTLSQALPFALRKSLSFQYSLSCCSIRIPKAEYLRRESLSSEHQNTAVKTPILNTLYMDEYCSNKNKYKIK